MVSSENTRSTRLIHDALVGVQWTGKALEALGFSSTEAFVEWAIAADPDQVETVAGTIAYLMKEM